MHIWLCVYELSLEFHEGFVFLTVLAWSVSMGGEVKSSRGTCQCMQLSSCCLKLWSRVPPFASSFFNFLSWSLFSLCGVELHNHVFFSIHNVCNATAQKGI